jgi:hypothetical protein
MASGDATKDFVEHLRTVHFSLVAVTLGLLDLVNSPGPRDLITARNQIGEILDTVSDRNWVPTFLSTFAPPNVQQAGLRAVPIGCKTIEWSDGASQSYGSRVTLVIEGSNWLVSGFSPRDESLSSPVVRGEPFDSDAAETKAVCAAETKAESADSWSWISAPTNLGEFQAEWDELNDATIYLRYEFGVAEGCPFLLALMRTIKTYSKGAPFYL